MAEPGFVDVEGIGRVYPDPKFFTLPEADQMKAMSSVIATAKKSAALKPSSKALDATPVDTGTAFNPNAFSTGNDPGVAAAAAAENRANFVKSATGVGESIVHLATHIPETAQGIKTLGKGLLQKAGVISGNDAEPAAEAAWKGLVDRYGSLDALKKTIHNDPVGFLMDVSAGAGGIGLAGKAAGAGDVARAVSTVGNAVDPLAFTGRAIRTGVEGAGAIASVPLGAMTGAGGQAVRTAYQAGKEGGDAAKAFKEGFSGDNMAQAVTEAKAAVGELRAERGAVYRGAMAKIAEKNPSGELNSVLDFNKVDEAVQKVSDVKNFKGQDTQPKTAAIREEMKKAVDDWKELPPLEFHTVEGLDALKQKLGDIMDSTLPNTPARRVAGEIYNGVRQTIIDQAPEYAKVMKGYEQASDLIREIESTLSLKKNANIDTSLRKLQSVLRNNVSTNYGRRAELMDYIQASGAPHLLQRLAGQALSSPVPRGISALGALSEGAGAATSLAFGHPRAAAALIGTALASSPKLVGGTAYGLGTGARLGGMVGRPLGQSAFQLNRFGQQ